MSERDLISVHHKVRATPNGNKYVVLFDANKKKHFIHFSKEASEMVSVGDEVKGFSKRFKIQNGYNNLGEQRSILIPISNLNNKMDVISYHDLKAKYKSIDRIPYFELLRTNEWKEKRLKIIQRDNIKCQGPNCLIPPDFGKPDAFGGVAFNPKFVLHVHHKYYVNDWLPWQFPDDALITLCATCHQTLHDNVQVSVYKQIGENNFVNIDNFVKCSKCSGSGYLHEYNHVQSGICFDCDGFGLFMCISDI
jgi:hypothetical protein